MGRALPVAIALVLLSCTVSSPSTTPTPAASSPEPPHTPAPAEFISLPDAQQIDGGCGQTTMVKGGVSETLARSTGNNVPTGVPYAIARPPIAAAFVFGHPLHMPDSGITSSNKILWVVGTARTGPLLVEGRPLGRSAPFVAFTFPANSGPGEIYPSGVDVPEPGCWRFTLQWAGQQAEIDLLYR